MLLLFFKETCQYDILAAVLPTYAQQLPSSGGGAGGDFPGLPWMPSGGGDGVLYSALAPAAATYTPRPASGGGQVCD